MSGESIRIALMGQRMAIVDKIEEAAHAVLTEAGDEDGSGVVAEVLRQAAEIARWTIYDPSGDES